MSVPSKYEMDQREYRRDLEYGYPSVELGVDFSLGTSCECLEILHYDNQHGTRSSKNNRQQLDADSLASWLKRDVPGSITTENFAGGLRLIMGTCTFDSEKGNRLLPFTRESFDLVAEKVQLPEKFLPTMASRASAAYKFSCLQQSNPETKFSPATCWVFRLGIYRPSYYMLGLSYDPNSNLTYGLLLAKTPDHHFQTLTKSLIKSPLTHPLHLVILLVDICTGSSSKRIEDANNKLNESEEVTGQHEWGNRPIGDPLRLDFVVMTRQFNFLNRILAIEKMRLIGRKEMLDWLAKECGTLTAKRIELNLESQEMGELIDFHKDTSRNLLLRVDYEEKRIQMQLGVVYQFMAQKSANLNTEFASISADIASESKKDSSAMKAIAVLTMFFLPGTFLAAIFAMPFFNWDGGDLPIMKSEFKYYWAFAVPLTAAVLLMWAATIILPWKNWAQTVTTRCKKQDVEAADSKKLE